MTLMLSVRVLPLRKGFQMNLSFLYAHVPLTKRIIKKDGMLDKKAYPETYLFTSETVTITDAASLFDTIKAHAEDPRSPALLSGPLNKPLKNQSRAGSTTGTDMRQLIIIDGDKAKFNNPDELMKTIGLEDISYTVQYSASQGLDKTLNCHIFILLDKPVPAPKLKAWLMWVNLHNESLKGALTLCAAGHALHYSIDITVCQNDKLIYIATPQFEGLDDPWKEPRIQFVKRAKDTLSITRLADHAIDSLKGTATLIRDTLRKAAGLTKISSKEVMKGGFLVQKGVGQVTITGIKKKPNGFTYFNLNGGDSWAYYHPHQNFELIHSFKGEAALITSEVAPDYYAEQCQLRDRHDSVQHEAEDIIMVFINKHTAEYKKLKYIDNVLEITPAKNKEQLADFMMENQSNMPSFIPEWETIFNPQTDVVIDPTNRTINLFKPSPFMFPENQHPGEWPNIQLFLESAIGTGEIYDYFLNWLAVIWQHRCKTQTSQVWQGVQGTGKGKIIELILKPLFGYQNVVSILASSLDEEFNAFMENALIVFIDEIEADMFKSTSKLESKLRKWITEPTIDIRRMRTDTYSPPSYINLIFASNKPKPVDIPPTDRRTNVGQFQHKRFLPTDEQHDGITAELPAFAHYLQHRETDIAYARAILDTEDRKEIQRVSINSLDELATGLLTGDFECLASAMPDERLLKDSGMLNPTASAYINLVKRCSIEERSNLTRDELAVIFEYCVGRIPEGKHKFTSYLRHHGINTKRIRIDGELTYGLQIDWQPHDFSYTKTKSPLRSIK